MIYHPFVKALLTVLLMDTTLLAGDPQVFTSAETRATLVEMYSSEGCSSCPPAEEWVSGLKTSPDLWKRIVPVVFHVDYWDHLGWPDRFASRDFTTRQHRYADAWNSASVYTPGFAVNGREWRGWFEHTPLPGDSASAGKLTVTLRDPTHAEVSFVPAGSASKRLQAELALLGGNLESNATRGENKGRRLRHDFVVLHLATAPLEVDGHRFTASIALPGKLPESPLAVAAWIVPAPAQPPLQATGGWLAKP
jgi:hypothetical protein